MQLEALRLESVLLVLIDFAEGPLGAVQSMPQAELRAAAGCTAQAAALLDLPVFLLHAPLPGGLGTPLPEVLGALPNPRIIEHSTNDSWETAELVEAVQSTGRKQLVFAGIATEVGVGLTALSAMRAGYQVMVLVDACGTVSARAEQAAFHRLSQAGVILHSWSGFLAEVQRSYVAPKGKELLRIIGKGIAQHGLFDEVPNAS